MTYGSLIHIGSPPFAALLAAFLVAACDGTERSTGPASPADYNSMPAAEEYAFSKIFHSTTPMAPWWACTTSVHRKRVRGDSGSAIRRFIDGNSTRCILVGFHRSDASASDSESVSASYSDTVSFRETADSLIMDGADRFFSRALREGAAPSYPMGLVTRSVLVGGPVMAFPKRVFPVVSAPPGADAAMQCPAFASGRTTPCRQLFYSDFRYTTESAAFAPKIGFYAFHLDRAGAPLGSSGTEAVDIRLLYSITNGDTAWYAEPAK